MIVDWTINCDTFYFSDEAPEIERFGRLLRVASREIEINSSSQFLLIITSSWNSVIMVHKFPWKMKLRRKFSSPRFSLMTTATIRWCFTSFISSFFQLSLIKCMFVTRQLLARAHMIKLTRKGNNKSEGRRDKNFGFHSSCRAHNLTKKQFQLASAQRSNLNGLRTLIRDARLLNSELLSVIPESQNSWKEKPKADGSLSFTMSMLRCCRSKSPSGSTEKQIKRNLDCSKKKKKLDSSNVEQRSVL